MFDREKAIEALIDDDFDAIVGCRSWDYLYDILYHGHLGYDHMTDNELVDECAERDIPYEFGETE
jgi:hypothetical protein